MVAVAWVSAAKGGSVYGRSGRKSTIQPAGAEDPSAAWGGSLFG